MVDITIDDLNEEEKEKLKSFGNPEDTPESKLEAFLEAYGYIKENATTRKMQNVASEEDVLTIDATGKTDGDNSGWTPVDEADSNTFLQEHSNVKFEHNGNNYRLVKKDGTEPTREEVEAFIASLPKGKKIRVSENLSPQFQALMYDILKDSNRLVNQDEIVERLGGSEKVNNILNSVDNTVEVTGNDNETSQTETNDLEAQKENNEPQDIYQFLELNIPKTPEDFAAVNAIDDKLADIEIDKERAENVTNLLSSINLPDRIEQTDIVELAKLDAKLACFQDFKNKDLDPEQLANLYNEEFATASQTIMTELYAQQYVMGKFMGKEDFTYEEWQAKFESLSPEQKIKLQKDIKDIKAIAKEKPEDFVKFMDSKPQISPLAYASVAAAHNYRHTMHRDSYKSLDAKLNNFKNKITPKWWKRVQEWDKKLESKKIFGPFYSIAKTAIKTTAMIYGMAALSAFAPAVAPVVMGGIIGYGMLKMGLNVRKEFRQDRYNPYTGEKLTFGQWLKRDKVKTAATVLSFAASGVGLAMTAGVGTNALARGRLPLAVTAMATRVISGWRGRIDPKTGEHIKTTWSEKMKILGGALVQGAAIYFGAQRAQHSQVDTISGADANQIDQTTPTAELHEKILHDHREFTTDPLTHMQTPVEQPEGWHTPMAPGFDPNAPMERTPATSLDDNQTSVSHAAPVPEQPSVPHVDEPTLGDNATQAGVDAAAMVQDAVDQAEKAAADEIANRLEEQVAQQHIDPLTLDVPQESPIEPLEQTIADLQGENTVEEPIAKRINLKPVDITAEKVTPQPTPDYQAVPDNEAFALNNSNLNENSSSIDGGEIGQELKDNIMRGSTNAYTDAAHPLHDVADQPEQSLSSEERMQTNAEYAKKLGQPWQEMPGEAPLVQESLDGPENGPVYKNGEQPVVGEIASDEVIHHTLSNNVSYSVDDNGKLSIAGNNVVIQSDIYDLLKSEDYGAVVENGEVVQRHGEYTGPNAYQMAANELKNVDIEHSVYNDMLSRVNNGEELTQTEKDFMSKHESDLHRLGLADNDGKLVRDLDNKEYQEAHQQRLSQYGLTEDENGYLRKSETQLNNVKDFSAENSNSGTGANPFANVGENVVDNTQFSPEALNGGEVKETVSDVNGSLGSPVSTFELTSAMQISYDTETGMYSIGDITADNKQFVINAATDKIQILALQDVEYQKIMENGGPQGEEQTLFVKNHEESLKAFGLEHDDKGKLINPLTVNAPRLSEDGMSIIYPNQENTISDERITQPSSKEGMQANAEYDGKGQSGQEMKAEEPLGQKPLDGSEATPPYVSEVADVTMPEGKLDDYGDAYVGRLPEGYSYANGVNTMGDAGVVAQNADILDENQHPIAHQEIVKVNDHTKVVSTTNLETNEVTAVKIVDRKVVEANSVDANGDQTNLSHFDKNGNVTHRITPTSEYNAEYNDQQQLVHSEKTTQLSNGHIREEEYNLENSERTTIVRDGDEILSKTHTLTDENGITCTTEDKGTIHKESQFNGNRPLFEEYTNNATGAHSDTNYQYNGDKLTHIEHSTNGIKGDISYNSDIQYNGDKLTGEITKYGNDGSTLKTSYGYNEGENTPSSMTIEAKDASGKLTEKYEVDMKTGAWKHFDANGELKEQGGYVEETTPAKSAIPHKSAQVETPKTEDAGKTTPTDLKNPLGLAAQNGYLLGGNGEAQGWHPPMASGYDPNAATDGAAHTPDAHKAGIGKGWIIGGSTVAVGGAAWLITHKIKKNKKNARILQEKQGIGQSDATYEHKNDSKAPQNSVINVGGGYGKNQGKG